jgi:hypothetical protein
MGDVYSILVAWLKGFAKKSRLLKAAFDLFQETYAGLGNTLIERKQIVRLLTISFGFQVLVTRAFKVR